MCNSSEEQQRLLSGILSLFDAATVKSVAKHHRLIPDSGHGPEQGVPEEEGPEKEPDDDPAKACRARATRKRDAAFDKAYDDLQACKDAAGDNQEDLTQCRLKLDEDLKKAQDDYDDFVKACDRLKKKR